MRTAVAETSRAAFHSPLLAKKALCVRGFHVDPKTRKRQELVGLPVSEQGALF